MPERPCHIASITYLLSHSYRLIATRDPAECRHQIRCDPHSSHYTTKEKQIMPVMGKRSDTGDNGKLPLLHAASAPSAKVPYPVTAELLKKAIADVEALKK